MGNFSFTALAECDMCGEPLSSSDDECDACAEAENVLMVFRRLQSHETRTLKVSMMIDNDFLWEKFARSLADESGEDRDPLPYVLLGTNDFVESMLDSINVDDITDIKHRQMTIDYRGEEDLRELASYEDV